MGILTDPSFSTDGGIIKVLAQHKKKICLLLYLASLGWFCCLGMPDFNHSTYLSENALSPGEWCFCLKVRIFPYQIKIFF